MITWVALGVMGFASSLLITPLSKWLSARLGIMDFPDGRRKLHRKAIPLAGGMAIFAASALTLFALALYSQDFSDSLRANANGYFWLFVSASLILILGVADDLGYLRGRHKFCGQIVAALLVVLGGTVVSRVSLFGHDIELGLLSIPVTTFILVATINALNLLDGMDGLLSSLAVVIGSAIAVMALLNGQPSVGLIAVCVTCSVLGFLIYNFSPASVFLGDSGSMLIGLLLGTLALRSQDVGGGGSLNVCAMGAIFFLPVLDTLAAIVRRKLSGKSLYATDLGHWHHCQARRGYSARQVMLLSAFLSGICATAGVLAFVLKTDWLALAITVSALTALIASGTFGRPEWLLFRKRVESTAKSFLRIAGGKPHRTEIHLQGTWNWKQFFASLVERMGDLNLQRIRLDIDSAVLRETYHGEWHWPEKEMEPQPLWSVQIPLWFTNQSVGALVIVGFCDLEPLSRKIALATQLVEDFERDFQERHRTPEAAAKYDKYTIRP